MTISNVTAGSSIDATWGNAVADQLNLIGMTWQDWTPVVTQPGTITQSGTVARYIQIGDLVVAMAYIDISGTGTSGNFVRVSLPVAPADNTAAYPIGSGTIFENPTTYIGHWYIDSGSDNVVFNTNTTGSSRWGNAGGEALDSSSFIRMNLAYEA